MTVVLDGFQTAKKIRTELKNKTQALVDQGLRAPSLTVVIVGEDPASQTYVVSKEKQAASVGYTSSVVALPATISQDALVAEIEALNNDDSVDGILVQLPLPNGLNEHVIIDALDPRKDVDGLHPYNVGLLELGRQAFEPCTPKGIMRLLKHYDVALEGKKALVIGRSRLVGKPIATLLTQSNATVTLAHSRTQDMEALVASHDIIVVAIGKQEFIPASWITSDHVLIDVGIHRSEDGLRGDVQREAYGIAAYATPVPKGVGPMTIASLLENTMEAYERGMNHG